MKVLASNESASKHECGFSKVVEFENGKKFKITQDTGNCYSHTFVYVMLPDCSWTKVADGFDIGANGIDYFISEDLKRAAMKGIYDKAIAYIKAVFL